MARTPAEEQIEALKKMRAEKSVRKQPSAPAPRPKPTDIPEQPAAAALPLRPRPLARAELPPSPDPRFELAESGPAKPSKPEDKALPVSRETWRRLKARQARTKEFKRRRDMGEWAAELLLAMPPRAHLLSPEGKADLFARLQEWGKVRGLK